MYCFPLRKEGYFVKGTAKETFGAVKCSMKNMETLMLEKITARR